MPKRFILGRWLHYRLCGEMSAEQPPIILLHHGFGHADGWRRFPDALRQATGRSVLAYSRAGCGRSDAASQPRGCDYLQREACETLPAIMASFGLEKACLYGHSDGATIALIAAAQRPDLVEAVVAEAPHVFAEPQTLAGVRAMAERFGNDPTFFRMLARNHCDPQGAFRAWSEVWQSPDFADWTVVPLLPSIRAPLLLLQGDEDPFGSLEHVEATHEAVSGEAFTRILRRVGHAPHRTEERIPNWVAELLADLAGSVTKCWRVEEASASSRAVSWA